MRGCNVTHLSCWFLERFSLFFFGEILELFFLTRWEFTSVSPLGTVLLNIYKTSTPLILSQYTYYWFQFFCSFCCILWKNVYTFTFELPFTSFNRWWGLKNPILPTVWNSELVIHAHEKLAHNLLDSCDLRSTREKVFCWCVLSPNVIREFLQKHRTVADTIIINHFVFSIFAIVTVFLQKLTDEFLKTSPNGPKIFWNLLTKHNSFSLDGALILLLLLLCKWHFLGQSSKIGKLNFHFPKFWTEAFLIKTHFMSTQLNFEYWRKTTSFVNHQGT